MISDHYGRDVTGMHASNHPSLSFTSQNATENSQAPAPYRQLAVGTCIYRLLDFEKLTREFWPPRLSAVLAVLSGFTRFAAGRIDGLDLLGNKRRRSCYAIVTPIVVLEGDERC